MILDGDHARSITTELRTWHPCGTHAATPLRALLHRDTLGPLENKCLSLTRPCRPGPTL
jgi:hypothetical protein